MFACLFVSTLQCACSDSEVLLLLEGGTRAHIKSNNPTRTVPPGGANACTKICYMNVPEVKLRRICLPVYPRCTKHLTVQIPPNSITAPLRFMRALLAYLSVQILISICIYLPYKGDKSEVQSLAGTFLGLCTPALGAPFPHPSAKPHFSGSFPLKTKSITFQQVNNAAIVRNQISIRNPVACLGARSMDSSSSAPGVHSVFGSSWLV
jgi:hypothetical protein